MKKNANEDDFKEPGVAIEYSDQIWMELDYLVL